MIDASAVKTIFFDTFNTLYSMGDCTREEITAYAAHVNAPAWSPLTLPDHWRKLPAHDGEVYVLDQLRRHFRCIAFSNGPVDLQIDLAKHNGVSWDFIVPLEAYLVFKPNLAAYLAAIASVKASPESCLMVTANKDFGDIEGAKAAGMQAIWIDRKKTGSGNPTTFSELFNLLVKGR